jgi:hypothetical protein
MKIKQFQEVYKLATKQNKTSTDIFDMVAAYKGINWQDIPIKKVEQWAAEIQTEIESIIADKQGKFNPYLRIGWRFYRVRNKFKGANSAAQYVDLTTIYNSDKMVENCHIILAAMTCGKDYSKVKKRMEYFREKVDFKVAYGYALFFCKHLKIYESLVQTFSEEGKNQVGLKSIGDGLQHSTP